MGISIIAFSQSKTLDPRDAHRCRTNEHIVNALKLDPTLREKWRLEGKKMQLKNLSHPQSKLSTSAEIVIPVVFHIVDNAANQKWITDRDIYTQLELLNEAYGGKKVWKYKNVIPKEMLNLLGSMSVKFVLARRNPAGQLTSGIERRVFKTPSYINIKNKNKGGIDPWDVSKYINIWVGTFSGADEGLLGIATPPFYTSDGPQGMVIGSATLPYTTNVLRNYYASYNEGATLIHELGHYFYLWHTFGDQTVCNNDDFWVQPGWELPNGAGPEGDDTPEERDGGNAIFGNPSMNYSDGCTTLSYGEMYGSFMNYFDDRALFMFSKGHIRRVEGCIQLYRPGLVNSIGAIAPVTVSDAYLVKVSPYGSPIERQYVDLNSPLTALVRNGGTETLQSVTLSYQINNGPFQSTTFQNLNLAPLKDTLLNLGNLNAPIGQHTVTVFSSQPNGNSDDFKHNDTLQSFLSISNATVTAPFMENFSGTFPPAKWQIGNPQNNTTWEKSTTSGFQQAGAASVLGYSYTGFGELNELITPVIDFGMADSSLLSFKVAYAVTDNVDVSVWEGLEVYTSADDGIHYDLVYKKTGKHLATVGVQKTSFSAPPSNPERWREEQINLTPYLLQNKKLRIQFRHTNANGNNLYLDDINVSAFAKLHRDALPVAFVDLPEFVCGATQPKIIFSTNGQDPLTQLKINYQVDNGNVQTKIWSGNLNILGKDTVALSSFPTLSPGAHQIVLYTSEPNGLNDQNVHNDTIRKSFYVLGETNIPVSEGFEGSQFPPTNWGISLGQNVQWERTTTAAATGVASMFVRNFNDDKNSINALMSPKIKANPVYDSVFVSFDYAYGTSLVSPTGSDTLEVVATTDCGKTKISLWKKWGADLQTITGGWGNTPFVPGKNDWRNINLYLTGIVGNNDFQISIISKGNNQNNIYADNISVYGKIVPEKLKKQGYLVYPSPFHNQLILRHYQQPTNLQRAEIYNFAGQKIWSMQLNGVASKEIYVDTRVFPSGVYTVRLVYTDNTISERVVKQ